MRDLIFTEQALKEYAAWLKDGKSEIQTKIDRLLENILDTPFDGIGKPEPLVGDLSGMWSRRITSKDRLIYMVTDSEVQVLQCKGHYSDK